MSKRDFWQVERERETMIALRPPLRHQSAAGDTPHEYQTVSSYSGEPQLDLPPPPRPKASLHFLSLSLYLFYTTSTEDQVVPSPSQSPKKEGSEKEEESRKAAGNLRTLPEVSDNTKLLDLFGETAEIFANSREE